MKVYNYSNYEHYLNEQKGATEKKWGRMVYVRKATIQTIWKFLEENNKQVDNIICHGSRSGEEQDFFKYFYPHAYVIGTEISNKGSITPNTVVWDFNKVNSNWINKFDLVYTNSFDHCLSPMTTLKVWTEQLNEKGMLLLEWSDTQNMHGVTAMDPLNATSDEINAMMNDLGFNLIDQIARGPGLAKHAGSVLIYQR